MLIVNILLFYSKPSRHIKTRKNCVNGSPSLRESFATVTARRVANTSYTLYKQKTKSQKKSKGGQSFLAFPALFIANFSLETN